MKAQEKKLYDALQVKVSHFEEQGQSTIREFIQKEVLSMELFPSKNEGLSRIRLHFLGGSLVLYPGYWIVRNPKDGKIEVFKPSEFNLTYESIP